MGGGAPVGGRGRGLGLRGGLVRPAWAGPGRAGGRGEEGGGRAGAMGTPGMCPKSYKLFGVKNTSGEDLSAKKEGVWAKMG